ncbi:MAG: AI-2E family transporter [Gammaproteobacteria bacterium]|nr:AI-2E family transporter [Gammaproteobacteria bacterium]
MSNSTRNTATNVLVALAAFIVVIAGMQAAKELLVPFLLAGFIAVICAPPLFWLQRHRVPDGVALVLVLALVIAVGILLAALVRTSLTGFLQAVPGYEQQLRSQSHLFFAWLARFGVDDAQLRLGELLNTSSVMAMTATLLSSLGSVLTNSFLILLTVIFILLEASSFPGKVQHILGGHTRVFEPFQDVMSTINRYMGIKTLISAVTGLMIALWLMLIHVPHALLWGLVAFLFNFVPNIGSIIAAVPTVLLALVVTSPATAALAAGGYLVVNALMGNIIEPRVMGRGLGLSTLVVFVSLIFWGWVLGPVGMLLSVPLTMTVKIAMDHFDQTRWIAVILGPPLQPVAPAPGVPDPAD